MTRRLIVAGGAGYIGSHTCKLLAARGFEPIVYDNLSTGHRDAVRWGPFVEGDVLNTEKLAQTLTEYRPEAVIHFAGSAYVGESVEHPAKYYRNNVVGSLSLLDACRRADVMRVIFSSTCATYGAPDRLPITELTPQRPVSPYGRSKLMVEHILADYAAAYGLRYVALRYFNACGADPDGELTERHDPETHLIPCALLAASGALPHLSIFGDHYDTEDGTCERDFVHVTDLAQAHLLAVEYLRDGGANLAVNLGSGRANSIRQVLDAIRRVTARNVPIVVKARRPGDPPSLVADPTLASQRLGFAARFSDIDTIVSTAARAFGVGARPPIATAPCRDGHVRSEIAAPGGAMHNGRR
jgi:UDP-arabinose 4-epimerase